MKPNPNLQLRKIGRQYMIVEACAGNVNLTNVFTLNETAANLWQRMSEGDSTVEELTKWLCDEYDVEPSTAEADVKKQLEEWKAYGLVK